MNDMIEFILGTVVGVGGMIAKDKYLGNTSGQQLNSKQKELESKKKKIPLDITGLFVVYMFFVFILLCCRITTIRLFVGFSRLEYAKKKFLSYYHYHAAFCMAFLLLWRDVL